MWVRSGALVHPISRFDDPLWGFYRVMMLALTNRVSKCEGENILSVATPFLLFLCSIKLILFPNLYSMCHIECGILAIPAGLTSQYTDIWRLEDDPTEALSTVLPSLAASFVP